MTRAVKTMAFAIVQTPPWAMGQFRYVFIV